MKKIDAQPSVIIAALIKVLIAKGHLSWEELGKEIIGIKKGLTRL
jgi:hypothetical protein